MSTIQLSALADGLVEAGAPGAAVMVVDGREVDEAAAGLADLETGRPMQTHLRFRAGSLTKSLVAAAILALVAERRVTLSDTIERWLPGILAYGSEVTVRQLLNHTGGIPNNSAMLGEVWYGSPEGRFRSWTPQELVSVVADLPLEAAPGTTWTYSNVGYILLGLIVEEASGSTLAAELNRVVFEPFSLHDTWFPVDTLDVPGPSSKGYSLPLSAQFEVREGSLVDFTEQHPSLTWAAGAAVSTLSDLCRFFGVLLDGGRLSKELLGEVLTMVEVPPESLPLRLYDHYGLGLVGLETARGPLVGNLGGIPGFLSMVVSTPDGGRQAGVMINVGVRAPEAVGEVFKSGIGELGSRLWS